MKKNIIIVPILIILMITIIGNISYGANTTNKSTTKNTANAKIENTEDGLESLKIEGAEISPEFKTDTYYYKIKYIGEDTKLQIEETTTEPHYEVEIIGNEDLKEGENLITILVSNANGKNVATYQLEVNKSLVDEEAKLEEGVANKQEKQKNIAIIISCVAGAIALLIIIITIVKKIARRDGP